MDYVRRLRHEIEKALEIAEEIYAREPSVHLEEVMNNLATALGNIDLVGVLRAPTEET